MSEIVKKLQRATLYTQGGELSDLLEEAAARIKELDQECTASMAEIAAGRERAEKAEARAEKLEAALRWALPLAAIALEDCRLQRVKWGHNDIQGTYKSGKTWVGIYQREVDALEAARAALEDTP